MHPQHMGSACKHSKQQIQEVLQARPDMNDGQFVGMELNPSEATVAHRSYLQNLLVAHKLEWTLKTAQISVWLQYLLEVVACMQACDTVSDSAFAVAGRHLVLATAQGLDSHCANGNTVCAHPALQFQLSLLRQAAPWYFSRRLSMV